MPRPAPPFPASGSPNGVQATWACPWAYPDGGPQLSDHAAGRKKVFDATRKAKIAFLNGVNPENVKQMIDEGVRIGSGGQEAAEIGRKYTKRKMPW